MFPWTYKSKQLPEKYRKLIYYIYKKFINKSWNDCYSELKKVIPKDFHNYLYNYTPAFPNRVGVYTTLYQYNKIGNKYEKVDVTVDNVHEYKSSWKNEYYLKDNILYKAKVEQRKKPTGYKKVKKIAVEEKSYTFNYDFEQTIIANSENEYPNSVDITPFKSKLKDYLNEHGSIGEYKTDKISPNKFVEWCKENNFTCKIVISRIIKYNWLTPHWLKPKSYFNTEIHKT